MDRLISALKAIGEPTRLRLLALCAQGDLTVSEMVQILGQSQPRVSRHLKLLCEAGLLDRLREGSWVFHRLARSGEAGEMARRFVDLIPEGDGTIVRDHERLRDVKRERARQASDYFRANAEGWARIRSLHIAEADVEQAFAALVATRKVTRLLDVGTGTARLIEVLSGLCDEAIGIDLSREMLSVARVNLEGAAHSHCSVQQGDMYQIPFGGDQFDLVTIYQVLHYADEPGRAVAEAARVLAPGGRLMIADFAPHSMEELRERHQHRRLGFSDEEVRRWAQDCGLGVEQVQHLPGDPLTVCIWVLQKPK